MSNRKRFRKFESQQASQKIIPIYKTPHSKNSYFFENQDFFLRFPRMKAMHKLKKSTKR